MQTATIRLHSLPFNDVKTYLLALLFIAGNIALPQLFHLLPQGGITWLPIYFFTLIGAYKYGWRVGLLTAVMSPLVNSFCFGMPAVAALPAIMLKSVLLALCAGFAAHSFHKATLAVLALVVMACQLLGTAGEWLIYGDLYAACRDFRIGLPGMFLQIFGGYLIINSSKLK